MGVTTKDSILLIAVDNSELRVQILNAIESLPNEIRVLDKSSSLRDADLEVDIIVLETNDDIAALTQYVYEVYRKSNKGNTPLIVAVASTEQIKRNPAASYWIIDGHAAVVVLAAADQPDFIRGLVELLVRV